MPKKAGVKRAAAKPADDHAASGDEYVALARAALDSTLCYDQRLFIGPVNEDELCCTICSNVMRNPHIITENGDAGGKKSPCNCVFGSDCITKALAIKMHCPNDRRPVKEAFVKPFALTSRKVEALVVKCHLAPDECAATGQLGKDEAFWRKHQLKCDFAEVECQFCEETMLRRDMAQHLSAECSVNPGMVVPCPRKCGATFRRHASDKHDEECPNTPIRCDLGCKGTFFRKDQEAHDTKYASDHTRFLCIKLDAAETKASAQALKLDAVETKVSAQALHIKELQQEPKTLQSALKSKVDSFGDFFKLQLEFVSVKFEQAETSLRLGHIDRVGLALGSSETKGLVRGFGSLRPPNEAPTAAMNMQQCTLFFRLDSIATSHEFDAKCWIPYDWPEFKGKDFYISVQRKDTDDIGVYIECDPFPPEKKQQKVKFNFKCLVRQGSQVAPLAVSTSTQHEFSHSSRSWGWPKLVAVDPSEFHLSWKGSCNSHCLVAPSQVLFVDVYVWSC